MNFKELEGKKILITGAAGLIGKALVKKLLLYRGEQPIEVFALVRNKEKASAVFSSLPQTHLHLLVCDVCRLSAENLGINYVIHAASKTASKEFVTDPIGVVLNSVFGTKNLLDFACKNPIEGFLYLSTMEVYGTPLTDEKISEEYATNIDTMNVRSSYPESKRLCETLCSAYASQYGIPTKVARLTQTFGEGVDYNDGRVFAEFARCVIEQRDIVLKTKGETKRSYIDLDDAVDALFTILLYGKAQEAYNVANESTYCSIFEMASSVAKEFGENKVHVRIEEEDNIEKLGYAKTLKMNLSTEKLKNLGWSANVSLLDSYRKMITDMKHKIK